jgi:hypothetical protein
MVMAARLVADFYGKNCVQFGCSAFREVAES